MENNSSKWEKLLQKIQEFRLLDDDFMSRVFDENIECTELILRIGLFRKKGRLGVREFLLDGLASVLRKRISL